MLQHEHFRFQIEEVFDIHKDPGGHYRHLTIVNGYLLEGTLRRTQSIVLPLKNKPSFTSIISSLAVNEHSSEVASVEQQAKIGLLLSELPFSGDEIEHGIAEGSGY